MKPRRLTRSLALVGTLSLLALGEREARADTLTIQNPGDHPRYVFEAEPHLVLGVIDPPGYASGSGLGLGFRGSFPLMHNGFVSTINNSVAIGFGIDFARYGRGDYCRNGGPLNECDDIGRNDGFNELYIPLVLQWNFFLSRNWSVFGEPGLALNYHGWQGPNDWDLEPFVFYAGGRFHFADRIALTMRIGYPAFSVGCSFLF